MVSKGVRVRPARPGVKPANKQLRTSVGDKVKLFTLQLRSVFGSYSFSRTLCLIAVPQLTVFTDGNTECYHAALCALY